MKIKIRNDFIVIKFNNQKEKTAIKSHFQFDDISKAITSAGFDPKKIKKVNLMKTKKDLNFLFSGFLQDLLFFCKKAGFTITEIEDDRDKFISQKKEPSNLEKYFPFDYNQHEVSALKKLLKVSYGICKAPTGGGKGDVIMSYILETNLPTLLLVNKITLANQLKERALESGIKSVGVWHSKEKTEGEQLQIATIGSAKGLKNLSCFKVLMVDEIHRAASNTFQEFLKGICYPIRIGFSATPEAEERNKYKYALIRQFFGEIVTEIKPKELLDNKVIAKPKIKFVKVQCPPTLDWPSAYQEGIINNIERNSKIVDIIEEHNRPTLVLINDVKNKQGEKIKERIEELTLKKVEYISGSNQINREDAIEKLENEEIDVLISTNILNEGVSIKNVHLLINASGRKSKVETLQKLGRGVRIKEGKEKVLVYDFFDYGNKFTQRHSTERMKTYKNEGYDDIELLS